MARSASSNSRMYSRCHGRNCAPKCAASVLPEWKGTNGLYSPRSMSVRKAVVKRDRAAADSDRTSTRVRTLAAVHDRRPSPNVHGVGGGVGGAVGVDVGGAVGGSVGSTVGGGSVGATVGGSVGGSVGSTVGGGNVGATVGGSVGGSVGSTVGGGNVGATVGGSVGGTVGGSVGATVGSPPPGGPHTVLRHRRGRWGRHTRRHS